MLAIDELKAICQTGKESDPGWYAVHRRWSIWITAGLIDTGVTADQVSLAMMALGVGGAALLACSPAIAVAGGSVLLYVAFLLDKVDGEVARYRDECSPRGILLDRFHHRLIEPLAFVALAWREQRLLGGGAAVPLALVVVVLANVIEEQQQLSPYILLKFMRGSGRWPRAVSRPDGALHRWHDRARVLKGFRTFIVACPVMTVLALIGPFVHRPLLTMYLSLSALGLGVYLPLQCLYYHRIGLDEEIAAARPWLSQDPEHRHAGSSAVARLHRTRPGIVPASRPEVDISPPRVSGESR
jgi:phosphatidylglycerophosphate synthase